MQRRKQIIVTVANDGEVTIETRGYTGKSCIEQSRFLKDLLGEEVAVQLCPTYYQKEDETVTRILPLCG